MEDPPAATHDTGGDFDTKYSAPSPSAFTSFDVLKGRIREHYEVCSAYYYSLWQAT
jgi:tocopherol O-methyltransferase